MQQQQLRFAPRATGCHDGAVGKVRYSKFRFESAPRRLCRARRISRIAIYQHIADIGSFSDCSELQPRGQFGRQIFQTMHGHVRPILEQRDFEFFCEQTFWQRFAFLRQRGGLKFVAGRLDDL